MTASLSKCPGAVIAKYIPKTIDFKEARPTYVLLSKILRRGKKNPTIYHHRSSSSVPLISVALLMKTHRKSFILLVRNGHPHASTKNRHRREPGERSPPRCRLEGPLSTATVKDSLHCQKNNFQEMLSLGSDMPPHPSLHPKKTIIQKHTYTPRFRTLPVITWTQSSKVS